MSDVEETILTPASPDDEKDRIGSPRDYIDSPDPPEEEKYRTGRLKEYIDSPDPPEEEKDRIGSPKKCIDSPDPPEVPDVGDTLGEKTADVLGGEDKISQVSKEGKQFAAMEMELDFEDFVGEATGEKDSHPDKMASQLVDEPRQGNDERDSEEDGQCCNTPEKNTSGEKKEGSGEDDGELCTDDEEDLEEGELKEEGDENAPKQGTRQVCRFFHRGLCFYGSCCRFLHVNVDKGNYNMFAPSLPPVYSAYPDSYGPGNMVPGLKMSHNRRSVHDFIPAPLPPAPPPPALESAWERGLKEAKALVKKANKRKEDPDFNEKRLNLSLKVNEKNLPEFDKENEGKSKRRKTKEGNYTGTAYKYQEPVDSFSGDYYDAPPSYSKEHYENFEVRYTNMRGNDDRRDRSRGRRPSMERGRFPRPNRRGWNDMRSDEMQSRSRGDEFFDPWRRSKSPNRHRSNLSRSGSYSSVSSYSYSDRSRSSCSYSHSSSRSSSRSPSVQQQKRKQSPPAETAVGPNRFAPLKKKPGARERSSSSRSRSRSRTRSRSYSRSISMSSVSSASSSISHSSSGSGLQKKRNAHGPNQKKPDEKPQTEKSETIAAAEPHPETPEPPKFDTGGQTINIGGFLDEVDPLEEKFHSAPISLIDLETLHKLIPDYPEKPKEPVKGLHKQPIKLTLLNKNAPTKIHTFPKKDLEFQKTPDELLKAHLFQLGIKRPLSPPASPMPPPPRPPPPPLISKKSASSRRDELLKQLKAVEDAIARKRAKF